MPVRVVAVDIGSVSTSKFAWASLIHPNDEAVQTGDDPQSCIDVLVDALRAKEQTALSLLLEAPAAVPVPGPATGWRGLGRTRIGEGNRPWSAGAGTGALATALAQGAWMLAELAALLPALTVTTQVGICSPRWHYGRGSALIQWSFATTFSSSESNPFRRPN